MEKSLSKIIYIGIYIYILIYIYLNINTMDAVSAYTRIKCAFSAWIRCDKDLAIYTEIYRTVALNIVEESGGKEKKKKHK